MPEDMEHPHEGKGRHKAPAHVFNEAADLARQVGPEIMGDIIDRHAARIDRESPHVAGLQMADAIEPRKTGHAAEIPAHRRIADQPRGVNGQVYHQHDKPRQPRTATGPEEREREGKDRKEDEDRERVGQRHQAESESRGGNPAQVRPAQMAGAYGPQHGPHIEIEQKQQEHLRQPGEGVAPHRIANQDKAGGHDGQAPVEEFERDEVKHPQRGEEKDNPHDGDGPVPGVNRALARQVPVGVDGDNESRRVEQRRKRRVVGIVLDGVLYILAMAAQFADGQRTNELRLPAVAAKDLAADLRLIHRLRHREPPELVKQVKHR